MNAELLLSHFQRISDAPHALPRLRRFIVDLAVRGKLVEQDPKDEPAAVLLKRTQMKGTVKAKSLPPLGNGELPFILPANWQADRFGNLLELQYGKSLPAQDRKDNGAVAVYGSNGIVGFHTKSLTNDPAIIVGRKGSAGALNLSHTPSWTTDVAYFISPPGCFEIRFLLHLLTTLSLESLSRGIKPGLSRAEAYQLSIVIPPIAEQCRIVAKVDELMVLCDHLEAEQRQRETQRDRLASATLYHVNSSATAEALRKHGSFYLNHFSRLTIRPEQLPAVRQTILNLAVRGQLVPQVESDEPASELLKRIYAEQQLLSKNRTIPQRKSKSLSNSIKLAFESPKGWESVNFGQLCNMITSGSRGWAEYYSESGPKFLRAQNIRFGKLRLDDLACVTPPKNGEGTRTQVSRGDVLIVITGAGVTNPALLDRDLGEAYVSQHVALIKPTDTSLSPWLLLCLMAPMGGRAELVERAYGAGKPGLNLDNIRSLTIPMPPPAEQHRILTKVNELMVVCDQLEAHLTTIQAASRRLLESVLYHALREDAATSRMRDMPSFDTVSVFTAQTS